MPTPLPWRGNIELRLESALQAGLRSPHSCRLRSSCTRRRRGMWRSLVREPMHGSLRTTAVFRGGGGLLQSINRNSVNEAEQFLSLANPSWIPTYPQLGIRRSRDTGASTVFASCWTACETPVGTAHRKVARVHTVEDGHDPTLLVRSLKPADSTPGYFFLQ